MSSIIQSQLFAIAGDAKLAKDITESYDGISAGYFSQNSIMLLQHVGVFVEGILRVAEHIVFNTHTPLLKKINIDKTIIKLEKASGPEGIRIHVTRLSRAAYDFRSRKKSVHLTAIDPQLIDAHLIFELVTWVLIEVLKESGLPDAEDSVRMLATRKIPLVESVDGILRTTRTSLSIPEKITLLLYAQPTGLTDEELFESTKIHVPTINRLQRDLHRLEIRDQVHKKKDGKWVLFGHGREMAEKLLRK
ncbi:MAG: hypothetical protein UX71_C0013G0014 [Parcubacteria group bacterium GW2011_GWA1_47_10]|nr:MAG: hypothetical protein UX71_C0013G0014 [Parcubacteria group bacterium GW2011_GWA1_47_10]